MTLDRDGAAPVVPLTLHKARPAARVDSIRYRAYQRKDIDAMPQLLRMSEDERRVMRAVSAVLPFRVNDYVLDQLIDWDRVPDDPIYQLTFPQRGMLDPVDLAELMDLDARGASDQEVQAAARRIQHSLNPHPAGQVELNVPKVDGEPLPGMQHKYRETVLFFPSQGQTCHAYCSYCFRWPQFVGLDDLKFASREAQGLVAYLRDHREVSSVLFTGGDPLIMRTALLRSYIEPLLSPDLAHVTTIRLGTKATAYWPYRFLTDPDADDLMRLFDDVGRAGRHLTVMSHYSHPRELETPAAQGALRRIRSAGAVVRCQAPLMQHVNDSASTWADMWRLQVQLGAVPYYMFIARDTGPKNYFDVSLARAEVIFHEAYRLVSGLARTVRGPSMSATPGKVKVEGVAEIHGEKVFVLVFEQARDPSWVGRPFFAAYDPRASWLTDLKPALGQREFFFEPAMRQIKESGRARAWGDTVPARRPSVLFGHVEWE
jgi:L-lysine 2,3-aminomutase